MGARMCTHPLILSADNYFSTVSFLWLSRLVQAVKFVTYSIGAHFEPQPGYLLSWVNFLWSFSVLGKCSASPLKLCDSCFLPIYYHPAIHGCVVTAQLTKLETQFCKYFQSITYPLYHLLILPLSVMFLFLYLAYILMPFFVPWTW